MPTNRELLGDHETVSTDGVIVTTPLLSPQEQLWAEHMERVREEEEFEQMLASAGSDPTGNFEWIQLMSHLGRYRGG